jgi:hypothetical protein
MVPWTGFAGLLDLAIERIRYYPASDVVISLRLLRSLDEVAATLDRRERLGEFVARSAYRRGLRAPVWPAGNCAAAREARPIGEAAGGVALGRPIGDAAMCECSIDDHFASANWGELALRLGPHLRHQMREGVCSERRG